MVNNSHNSDWTRSFRPHSTWRRGQLTLWTMAACALILPISIANRTEAEETTEAKATLEAATGSQNSTGATAAERMVPTPIEVPGTIGLTAIVSGQTKRGTIAPTKNMTVGQALAAMGVSLSALDRVVPDAAELVKAGQTLRVTRVQAELVTRRESIAAGVRYQPTTSLRPGAKQITQAPRAGYNEITERVWSKDGKETLREFVSKKQAQAPQDQIVSLGASSSFLPSRIASHPRYAKSLSYRGGSPRDRAALRGGSPAQLRVVRTLKMMTTGYNGAESGGGGPRTATGIRVGYGAIAVDPRVIPLGSQLYVEGYGYGFACDTGGAIKGNHIDLAYNSVRAANAHGKVRGVTVYILGE